MQMRIENKLKKNIKKSESQIKEALLEHLTYPPHLMDLFIDSLQFYTPILHNIMLFVGVECLSNGYLLGFYIHCLTKTIDKLLPLDDKNLEPEEVAKKKTHILYTIPLLLTVFADFIQMFYVLNLLTSGTTPLSTLNQILLLVSAGITMGNTINVSHELIHRLSFLEQAIGVINFFRMNYAHYQIFHILWHHKKVGTPEDPIVAYKNQNVYEYLPKQILGNYLISWKCENERLVKFEGASMPYLHYKNRMIIYSILQGIFMYMIYSIFNLKGLCYLLIMVTIAVGEAEVVEYLEHYGLFTTKDNIVDYNSSWNAPQRYTNISSFKLERHSDHHVNGHKQYQIASFDYKWPALPDSYLFMIQVALHPQTYFSVMNPRLEALLAKKSLTEEQSKKEKEILRALEVRQIVVHSILLAIAFVI